MSNADISTQSLVGVAIGGIVGGLLLLLTNFGWVYNFQENETYYVYFGSEIVEANIIIPLLAFPLLITAYLAVTNIQNIAEFNKQKADRMFYLSLFSLIGTIAAAVYLASIGEEYADWDFESGFYGGFIGSIIAVIFTRTVRV